MQSLRTIIWYAHDASISPLRRICELVPAEESAQPAFKIMRRSPADRRVRQTSQPGSMASEDGDVSDSAEPSEAGSSAGRSNTAGGSKRHLTIEEREAAYNEARSRIFMGFEEKEKDKGVNKRRRVVIPLVPFSKGPEWERMVGRCTYEPFNAYRIQLFNGKHISCSPFIVYTKAPFSQILRSLSIPSLSSPNLSRNPLAPFIPPAKPPMAL